VHRMAIRPVLSRAKQTVFAIGAHRLEHLHLQHPHKQARLPL
jgi:hypothetical protein